MMARFPRPQQCYARAVSDPLFSPLVSRFSPRRDAKCAILLLMTNRGAIYEDDTLVRNFQNVSSSTRTCI